MKHSPYVLIKKCFRNIFTISFMVSLVALTVLAQQKKVNSSEQLTNKQIQKEKSSKSKTDTNSRTNPQTRSRWLIASDIRRQILKIPNYSVFDWIEFNVERNGVIILRGDVTSRNKKNAAEELVKNIDGVKMVINEIYELPFSPPDERLRKAVFNEIYSGVLSHYQTPHSKEIHIIVNRGRIRLEGAVESKTDKSLAGAGARKASKLVYVDNQLVVANRQKQLY